MPRPPLLKGGGGGGAEVLCFIPLPVEELLLAGREMSGSEGRWERWCSGGEGLLAGEGEGERPVGGRGAAGRDPGGLRADLPTEPPVEPSGWRTEGWCLKFICHSDTHEFKNIVEGNVVSAVKVKIHSSKKNIKNKYIHKKKQIQNSTVHP